METTEISLKLNFNRRQATLFIAFLLLAWHPGFLGSETLTLTTYYPAPYGGYVSLLTTNQTLLARDGGNVGIGIAGPTSKLHVVSAGGNTSIDVRTNGRIMTGDASNNGGVWLSQSADGFVGNNGGNIGFWTNSGWAMQIVKSNGNVGIGNPAPSERLSVTGNISVSGDIVLSPNSYIRNFCVATAYSVTGFPQQCSNGGRIIGFMGDGVPRVTGFLPTTQTSSGVGKYVVLGEDWAGTMICCRFY